MKRFILTLAFFTISSVAFGQDIQLAKEKFSVTEVEPRGYEILLNQTRDSVGAGSLVRKDGLDKYCYERCTRLAKIFMADPENYYISFHQGESSIFHKEAHKGLVKSENADNLFSGKMIDSADGINNRYNKSLGHYKNRVNPEWKSYGACTIVISYKPRDISSEVSLPGKFIISYEAFE
jgi:hypothetical protein